MRSMGSRVHEFVVLVLVIALVVAVAHFGPGPVVEAAPLGGVTNFDSITLDSDLIVGDDATVTDDLAVSGAATIDELIEFTAATGIVVTQDGTVAPTGTYQPISAAGALGTSDITVADAGTFVTLVNTSSNTVTFTDTGTLKLSGNAALGQFDTLTLLSDGTNWLEVAQVDN